MNAFATAVYASCRLRTGTRTHSRIAATVVQQSRAATRVRKMARSCSSLKSSPVTSVSRKSSSLISTPHRVGRDCPGAGLVGQFIPKKRNILLARFFGGQVDYVVDFAPVCKLFNSPLFGIVVVCASVADQRFAIYYGCRCVREYQNDKSVHNHSPVRCEDNTGLGIKCQLPDLFFFTSPDGSETG